MSQTTPAEWPAMTAPTFIGSNRDGGNVYELHEHPDPEGGTMRLCAIYLRQSNGLWPCRSVGYHNPEADAAENARLGTHFASVIDAWGQNGEIVDCRTAPTVPLPPITPRPAYQAALNAETVAKRYEDIPARRANGNRGKLRDITRAESDAFNAALAALLADYAEPTEDGWTLATDFGPLFVHRALCPQSLYYGVAMRFDAHDKTALARAVERFGSHAVNPFSGKWNILETEGNDALDVLIVRLDAVGARRLVAV